jgi:hypothetical protein
MNIPQVRPTPIFCDSQSTVFVANDAAAAKKSIWVSRRAAVLREAVDDGTVSFEKIAREDNVADYLTRAVTHAEYLRFAQYICLAVASPSDLNGCVCYEITRFVPERKNGPSLGAAAGHAWLGDLPHCPDVCLPAWAHEIDRLACVACRSKGGVCIHY